MGPQKPRPATHSLKASKPSIEKDIPSDCWAVEPMKNASPKTRTMINLRRQGEDIASPSLACQGNPSYQSERLSFSGCRRPWWRESKSLAKRKRAQSSLP